MNIRFLLFLLIILVIQGISNAQSESQNDVLAYRFELKESDHSARRQFLHSKTTHTARVEADLMFAVIVEDERLSAERLDSMIRKQNLPVEIITILGSVNEAKDWFKDNSHPDLIFLDIQLGDGTAFDLIDDITPQVPIIFTTAFDEYAVRAFNFNSIDYLLKPIQADKLEKAVNKLTQLAVDPGVTKTHPEVGQLKRIIEGDFKKRFLVKRGDRFIPVDIKDIAYFNYQLDVTRILTWDGAKYLIDQSLDQLENMINPLDYFRINRQFIISLQSIKEIHTYFNSRLLINLDPDWEDGVIISREKVQEFKRWMNL